MRHPLTGAAAPHCRKELEEEEEEEEEARRESEEFPPRRRLSTAINTTALRLLNVTMQRRTA
jgi:hypothetical protein